MSVKFCKNCFTPNTRPRIVFNNQDTCNACLNSKEKKKTNWKQREKEFYKIIPNIKQFEIKANQNQNNNRLYSAFLSTTITAAATTTSCIFIIFLIPTFIFLQETILFTRSFHYSSLKYFRLL